MRRNKYRILTGVILFALLTNYSAIAHAQSNAIKTDVVRPFAGRYVLAYERTTKVGVAFQLGIETGRYSKGTINGKTDYLLTGVSVVPELRYYPFLKNGNVFPGFFIGEAVRLSSYKEQYNDLFTGGAYKVKARSNVTSFSLEVGYKVTRGNFCSEFAAGQAVISEAHYDVNRSRIPTTYTDQLSKGDNKFYRFRILVGYVFPRKVGS